MDDKTTKLNALRAQISALDTRLLDTLRERQGLMQAVAQAKPNIAQGLGWRPDVELGRMATLCDKAKEMGIPAASLLVVWREIMGAALAKQSPLHILVSAKLGSLAVQQFGQAQKYQMVETAEALSLLASDSSGVAVLPIDDSAAWWQEDLPAQTQIIAVLPLWGRAQDKPLAVCVGRAIGLPATEACAVGVAKDLPQGASRLAAGKNAILFAMPVGKALPKDTKSVGAFMPPLVLSA